MSWRVALTQALIPGNSDALPGLAALDLGDFWPRFDAVAPLHLRLGLALAGFTIAGVLPRICGHFSSLDGLSTAQSDAVLQRAETLPGLRDLLEVAKIVACLAYFDHAHIQDAVRTAP